ncbi:tetratricopeptide repeat protein [Streptococcus pluranimalium]|uniref:tetratricopeptide repeat protein n=1 Tax=Streptococcus pluranimalium TaxID=82348 RepID=UPI001C4D1EFD|nr:tetratricopeptide repeat protein [Streptococcus pluranimalium]
MWNSEKMVASIQSQDLAHADKYFERALKEDDEQVLLDLGAYLESIGFLPQAKRIYDQLRSQYPDVNLNLAQIVAEDGDFEGAFLYLDAIDSDSEDYVNALIIMADLYQMEGLADVARDKLAQALALSDQPLIRFGLAEMQMEVGDFKEAIANYAALDNRAILEETGVSTYERIGRAYADMGKFEAAIEFLEKAVEIDYDDMTVFELATLLFDQEEYQRANLYFKQLDTMNPDFAGYEYYYAQSLHEEHKIEEALKLTQQGLSKNAYDSQLLLLASQLAYENHDAKLSESYLLSAKDLAEDMEEVTLRLTNLYLEEERYEEVVSIEIADLDNLLAKWNVAKAHQALDQEEEAYAIYQDIAKDLNQNPEFLHDYAYILREFGQLELATETAKSYLSLVPDDLNMQSFLEELSH